MSPLDPTDPTAVASHARAPVATDASDDSPPARTHRAALALAAAGVVVAGVGVGFGLHARDLESQSDALCPATTCTDANAVALNSSARRDGWIADAGFAVGGIAVASAVALWWVGAPSAAGERVSIAPVVGASCAGLVLGGRF